MRSVSSAKVQAAFREMLAGQMRPRAGNSSHIAPPHPPIHTPRSAHPFQLQPTLSAPTRTCSSSFPRHMRICQPPLKLATSLSLSA